MKDDRRAADERLRKEQEKVDKALQAARNAGNKDREVKELGAQVDSLMVCYRRREFNKRFNDMLASILTLHVRYKSYYISKRSSAKQQHAN